jgi:Domain of unknown function (DUF1842)
MLNSPPAIFAIVHLFFSLKNHYKMSNIISKIDLFVVELLVGTGQPGAPELHLSLAVDGVWHTVSNVPVKAIKTEVLTPAV